MSVTAYPTLRLKLTVPQALKIRFLPAIPGTNAGAAAAAAQAAAAQAIAAAQAATAATASKVDKAGDVMTGRLTLSSDPIANLHAATKQYVDASIGGTGSVSTSGPVVATQLAGYADTTGNVIRGINVGAGLDMSAGTTLNLDSDLSAIAVLTGINTIYYRSSDAVWSPVIIGTNLSFAGGTLSAPAAGDVASVPTPTNGQFARWTDATHIEGISAATALTAIGAQPLDADLTALAALSGTNVIYFRSAANTWSPVLIGANMSFAGGTLSSSGGGGAGGVAAVGTPTTGQLARWTTATTIEGIDTSTLGLAPLASPTFTGDARSVTPATSDNDTSIATTAYVQAQAYLTTTAASTTYQPLDADLTAIAALAGTNTIYFRSAANTWSPVTFSGLTFSGGVLTATASSTAVTQQVFTAGSGTYTRPGGVTRIEVAMVGGGGGGGGGNSSNFGTSGGNTTFGTFTANGGSSPGSVGAGGAGGSASGGIVNHGGGGGGGAGFTVAGTANVSGGTGGNSHFGGGGSSGYGSNGGAGATNTGGGGGGGGVSAAVTGVGGGGGGAGGYVKGRISSPAATYSYVVGAGGSGGAAGSSASAGAAGGSGFIIVDEYY